MHVFVDVFRVSGNLPLDRKLHLQRTVHGSNWLESGFRGENVYCSGTQYSEVGEH